MYLSDEKKSEAAVSLQHSANGLSSITALFPSESLRQETLRRQHCTRLTVFSKQLGQRLVFSNAIAALFPSDPETGDSSATCTTSLPTPALPNLARTDQTITNSPYHLHPYRSIFPRPHQSPDHRSHHVIKLKTAQCHFG